jgi:group I intron endonuclease
MYIYLTTNTINNKKYIGMCSRPLESTKTYLGSGKLLHEAIKKYGRDAFKREILETCTTFEKLCEAEYMWIKKLGADTSDEYYNLNIGGLGGNSETLKKYWRSLSKDQRKQVRNWRGYFKNNPPIGDKNYWYKKSTSKIVKKVWENRSEEERKSIGKKTSETRKLKQLAAGVKNPMYGRSAVKEQNLKWYTDGINTIYVREGTQPPGFKRGRSYVRKV